MQIYLCIYPFSKKKKGHYIHATFHCAVLSFEKYIFEILSKPASITVPDSSGCIPFHFPGSS